MALFAHAVDSFVIENKRKIEERKDELFNERTNLIIKKIKNPPALSDIDIYLPEKEVISAVHEELSFRQMYKVYLLFLKNKKKIHKLKDTPLFNEDVGRFCKKLESKLERNISDFWRNKKRFDSAEKLEKGYFYGHKWFLHNNPRFAERYKNIDSSQLENNRKENQDNCNYLCSKMPKILEKERLNFE